MITYEHWRHGHQSFGVTISGTLLQLLAFGHTWELEWGTSAKGAGWVRRRASLEKSKSELRSRAS